MNSFSEELILAIAEFLVDPKDIIVLRVANKRMRTALPVLIGTNLEYFIEYAGRLEKFKDRMGYHHYGCSWSRVQVQSLLSWDLSKENSFPHHFFGAPYDTLVTAVTTIRRTCSHDSINDEDVVFLLDWCSSASSKDAFKKVLGIAK
jgi:hypothetical protein